MYLKKDFFFINKIDVIDREGNENNSNNNNINNDNIGKFCLLLGLYYRECWLLIIFIGGK